MILVVSLNPALDLTYEVEEADWGGVNRPHTVHVRPGGKGVNVARTLRALGHQVRLVGLVGGATGGELEERLAGSGIEVAFTAILGHTRRTLTVVDATRQHAALFNEPGPAVAGAEYQLFLDGYLAALGECDSVVLSGSLPGGVGAGAYAELITSARAASVPVILDTSGPALALGAAAGPTVVKPNLAELEHATEAEPATSGKVRCRSGDIGESSLSLVEAAAGELIRAGARSVVVSLGGEGLLAVTGEGCWLARPGELVSGNPTGAGDAVVAGLADGLVRGLDWPQRLRQAVALGTATVAAPVAGEFALKDYQRHHSLVQLNLVDAQSTR
ncbi:MAG TPA: 1-phosphofructokinase family hexose kinase [Streptosporangiaceae bacterium]|nr:1-phosphofructokinase family hexose kinase [Streptosporangiaceae bacterium]